MNGASSAFRPRANELASNRRLCFLGDSERMLCELAGVIKESFDRG
ncbi:MAG: hypothetical protein AB7G28_17765 [Pirellulales bacterium]